MAALVLALILFPLLSSATEQGHQALCGRVDGQAAPEDVQALLHHTLPLALPWDQAWLGSLQVTFYSAFNTCKILIRPEQWLADFKFVGTVGTGGPVKLFLAV